MSKGTDALAAVAVDVLDALIKHAGDGRGPFRCLTTMFMGSDAVPVLMVGTADGKIEDGEVIAILNPAEDLLERFQAGVGYHGPLLKEIVSGKCDAMVHVWLDAYSKSPTRAKTLASYTPRAPAAAPKFKVK